MKSKKGWIVIDAKYTQDEVSINTEGRVVMVLINGKEEKLRTEDRVLIPLRFDRDNWYEPKKIVPSIKRKFEHLQLPNTFDFNTFKSDFLHQCSEVSKKYAKDVKKGTPETSIQETQLQKWKDKWGSK